MDQRRREYTRAGQERMSPRQSRRMREIARRRQARNMLVAAFGVITALIITALLALPHLSAMPQEANAPVEPTPTPQPTLPPVETYQQLSDWQLVLVNEEVPLPDDFQITTRTYGGVEVNSLMYTDMCALMDDSYKAGHVLWLASGYRSVENQSNILEQAIESRMRGGMNREEAYEHARLTIQAPGFSEHHTGLAIDFNEVNYEFEESGEYAWLSAHAAEYGFIERYPEDKEEITGIEYEPWHYRYVGKEHALAMESLDMCLEEYVEYCWTMGMT